MNVCEVYALNVMPQDIAKFIGVSKDDAKIEECRNDFYEFLLDRQKDDIVYYSQVTAWESYKEWQIMFSDNSFEHLDSEEGESSTISWENELEKALEKQIKVQNYDENLGQM